MSDRIIDVVQLDKNLISPPSDQQEGGSDIKKYYDFEDNSPYRRLLDIAEDYWYNMQDFRDRRKRSRDYYRGDQWSDTMTDPESTTDEKITEKDFIERTGKTAMVNNQIRQVCKNLIGQLRDNDFDPLVYARERENQSSTEMMTNVLKFLYDINDLKEMDVRLFEEYLLSGVLIQKVGYDYNKNYNRDEVFIHSVHPTRICMNTDIESSRGDDIRFICQLHDMSLDNIVATFAKSEEDEEALIDIYSTEVDDESYFESEFKKDKIDQLDFRIPHDNSLGRVYEIWRLENKKKLICHDWAKGTDYQHPFDVDMAKEDILAENLNRIAEFKEAQIIPMDLPDEEILRMHENFPVDQKFLIDGYAKVEPVWMYYFLTHNGELIQKGESPYEHESHPYVISLYPMLDGEIWGFVEDIIDQQRHINRYISMIDSIVGHSAKGVLMIPEDSIPDNMDPEDFTDQWVRFNGAIVYKAKPGVPPPQQVVSNSTPAAAIQLLQLELSLLKEISGVSDAIQGQEAKAGTPASLYAQMATNSTISSRDFFEFFFAFKRKRDLAILKNAQQFYDEPKYVNVNGIDYDNDAYFFDPEKARDAEYDIVLDRTSHSPAFRELMDQHLMQLLAGGFIDFPMFLENTSMPGADKILQQLKDRQSEVESQLSEQGVAPEMVQPGMIQGGSGLAA